MSQTLQRLGTDFAGQKKQVNQLIQNNNNLVTSVEKLRLDIEQALLQIQNEGDRRELIQDQSAESKNNSDEAKKVASNAIAIANQALNSLHAVEEKLDRANKMLTDRVSAYEENIGKLIYDFDQELNSFNSVYLSREAFKDWQQETQIEELKKQNQKVQARIAAFRAWLNTLDWRLVLFVSAIIGVVDIAILKEYSGIFQQIVDLFPWGE